MNADRVVVVGWDCASPWLAFDHYADAMPNLRSLGSRGTQGPLRSCHPPITVPAWMCMASGGDAGQHGVYGFRGLATTPRRKWELTGAHSFRGPRPVWERLLDHGLNSRVIGVPGTWPTQTDRIVPGILTPDDHPAPQPGYQFDVADFRHLRAEDLLAEVTAMTQARFDHVEAVAALDDWNLLWVVEIGLDRLHHALWHHVDPAHPRFTGNRALDDALRAYYALLDDRLGRLVQQLDDGETTFLVVSDHGARPMHGGIRLNEWMRQQGWLTLLDEPPAVVPLDLEAVDWERTRAWTTGGYCARIYLEDKDPAFEAELIAALLALHGPNGEELSTEVVRTAEIWNARRGRAPELLVYLGDMDYRCFGTVGAGPLHQASNDRGPDAANHDWEGIFVGGGPGIDANRPGNLLEVAGLIEHLLGVPKASAKRGG